MEIQQRAKRVVCPHCYGELVVHFTLEIVDIVAPTADSEQKPGHWSDGLSEEEVKLITESTATGILGAFDQAVRRTRGGEAPKNMERFLLTFFKTARPVSVPMFVLRYFIEEFAPARIVFWAAQGIAVVLADELVKAFVPFDFVRGKSVKSAGGNSAIKARLPVDQEAFSEWVRTRFGYVIGKGAFFRNMQKRSLGEFGIPRI